MYNARVVFYTTKSTKDTKDSDHEDSELRALRVLRGELIPTINPK